MPQDNINSNVDKLIKYKLSHIESGVGVGLFACVPEKEFNFEEALEYGGQHPHDQFMRKHLLDMAGKFDPNYLEELIQKSGKDNLYLLALLYEACILNKKFEGLKGMFDSVDIESLKQFSPFIYISWSQKKDYDQNLFWLRLLTRNIILHKPLPPLNEIEFPIPVDLKSITEWKDKASPISDMVSPRKTGKMIPDRPAPKETVKKLKKKLEQLGILTGWEARPTATLSPYAVERPWNLDIEVNEGRNSWSLTGTLTSYGRGLNIHQARISCLMEAVERYSAFASIDSGQAPGYKKDCKFIKGRYEDLLKKEIAALNPNAMCLEVPYQNQEISWMPAEKMGVDGSRPVYVPVQMVFLFSNLDEISLSSGLPSNGLAAGSTIEDARLSGLLEVIERDAEKLMPYSRDRCFILEAEDPKVHDILEECKQKGILIQLLDISTEFGIPCYKAFVQGPGGVILKGAGAGLDGKRAALSAITEIPYPYPYWFGSMPPPEEAETVQFEDLPEYSSGDPSQDLALLEKTLIKNGYEPIYVDITKEDLDIPVVKALVPGLEIMLGLDRFSSLGIRQFGHYLQACD